MAAVAFGDWHTTVGWGSVSIAALVAFGSWVLLRTIRSTGSREAQRTGYVTIRPLMTLPGFASALLLAVVGAGLLGWLGEMSHPLVNGMFGLWWLSNAVALAQVRSRRRRHGRRPLVRIGVIAVAGVVVVGGWFLWAAVRSLL
jgi:hypothetical protein